MRRTLLLLLAIILISTSFNTSFASSIIPVSTTASGFDPVLVKDAFSALKNLPRKERKGKLKQAIKEIRNFKAARREGKAADTNTLLLVILALLLPPLAVYLHENEANTKFWVDLLLFVLGLAGAFFFSWLLIFAAVVYALIVILGGA